MQYRRKFPRYAVRTPVRFQMLPQKRPENSSSCDISQGGLSFLATSPLPKGSVVQLTVPVNDQVFKRTGRVAYCNHVSGIDRYRTGIEFQDQVFDFNNKLEEQQLRIKSYQDQLSQQLKRVVSEDEAARLWVEKFMQQFSSLF